MSSNCAYLFELSIFSLAEPMVVFLPFVYMLPSPIRDDRIHHEFHTVLNNFVYCIRRRSLELILLCPCFCSFHLS